MMPFIATPQSATVINYVEESEPPPTEMEMKIIRHMRQLRQNRKTCMLVVRFDGTIWQLLEARPSGRWSE